MQHDSYIYICNIFKRKKIANRNGVSGKEGEGEKEAGRDKIENVRESERVSKDRY